MSSAMRHTILYIYTLLLCLAFCGAAEAQTVLPGSCTQKARHIRTVQLGVNGDFERLPVIALGSGDRVTLAFDDLTHEYRRYTYTVEQCNADGTLNEELFDTEYLASPASEDVIENYENSLNTSVLYTHYTLTIPNANVRPKLSGNYRITVKTENDEGEEETALVAYFAVNESCAGLSITCDTDTEIDRNATHQQLSLRADLGSLPLRDASSEVKLIVTQNRRTDNALFGIRPTSVSGGVLLWEHCRDLIFNAGNEYRKMEMPATRYPGMHLDHIRYYDPYYHATVMPDTPRRNYLYDEDQNGRYVPRCENSAAPETEADYLVTHFALETDYVPGRRIFLDGRWTDFAFSDEYELHYDAEAQAYTAAVLLKQGYYSYQYLALTEAQPEKGLTAPYEGDFYQTSNEYAALLYYRRTGDRYDRLVGYGKLLFELK